MKRILIVIYLALLSMYGQLALAAPGPLFNVAVSTRGLTTNIAGFSLLITTTIPAKTYQFAGIKIKTPGYEILTDRGSNCVMAPNGYCLFSVSDTMEAIVFVSIPFLNTIVPNKKLIPVPTPSPSTVLITLCLNAKANTYSCEDHTVTLDQPV